MDKLEHGFAAYQSNFLSRLSLRVRKQIFALFMKTFAPTEQTRVLDVGVMGNAHPAEIEANCFEKLYPYPEMLHGVTLEDPSELQHQFPRVTFTRCDGRNLPFPDQSFDIVTSFAVVEHAGSREEQRRFVAEACRVGKNVFITTPNRWFPIEAHSRLPLVHFFPPTVFRAFLRTIGMSELAKEEKMNLLSERDFRLLFGASLPLVIERISLFGFTQNLAAIVRRA